MDGFARIGDKSISPKTLGMVDGEMIAWAGATDDTKRAAIPADILRRKYLFKELMPKSRNENI